MYMVVGEEGRDSSDGCEWEECNGSDVISCTSDESVQPWSVRRSKSSVKCSYKHGKKNFSDLLICYSTHMPNTSITSPMFTRLCMHVHKHTITLLSLKRAAA